MCWPQGHEGGRPPSPWHDTQTDAPRSHRQHSDHQSDVTWASWRLKSPATRLSVQQLVQASNKEDIKVLPYHWSFVVTDSPRKRPVMLKVSPLYDVIIPNLRHTIAGNWRTLTVHLLVLNTATPLLALCVIRRVAAASIWRLHVILGQ